jgi:hypothetical protein
MLLSREKYNRARGFVAMHGRPLEAARLRVAFDGAPASEVWDALQPFRNTDGGFGHGMEPDLQTPESSALATTVALQVVRETRALTGVEPPAGLVAPALGYLRATVDRERLTWRIIPPGAESSPHAPWWSQAENDASLDAWSLNPTAECLGYLYEYPAHASPELLTGLSDKILTYLAGQDTLAMHDFLCCKRWAETPGLDADMRSRLLDELGRLLEGVVCRDPAAWPGYVLRPVQVAEGPTSPFYPALREIIPANLDWEIEQQPPEGGWMPNWSWSDLYPEDWARAQVEWAGWITVEKLLLLKRYGRIAPPI